MPKDLSPTKRPAKILAPPDLKIRRTQLPNQLLTRTGHKQSIKHNRSPNQAMHLNVSAKESTFAQKNFIAFFIFLDIIRHTHLEAGKTLAKPRPRHGLCINHIIYKPTLLDTQPKEDIMKKRIALLVSTLALVALAGAAQAATGATMFAVQDSATNKDTFAVADTGQIVTPVSVKMSNQVTLPTSSPVYVKANTATGQHVGGVTNVIRIEGDSTSLGAGFIAHNAGPGSNVPPPIGQRLGFMFFGSNWNGLQNNAAGLQAVVEGTFDSVTNNMPAGFAFATTQTNARTEKMRLTGSGNLGIGTTTPTSRLQVLGLQVCPNNNTAKAALTNGCGGLTAGAFYIVGPAGGTPTLSASGNAELSIVF
jgi:hypothetical protein